MTHAQNRDHKFLESVRKHVTIRDSKSQANQSCPVYFIPSTPSSQFPFVGRMSGVLIQDSQKSRKTLGSHQRRTGWKTVPFH